MKCVVSGLVLVCLMLAVAGCESSSSDVRLPRRSTQAELNQSAATVLQELYRSMPLSKTLVPKAKAILVFPQVYKAGLMIGGQYGNGVALSPSGVPLGYFNISAASYGFQAGGQQFSYALFVMTDEAVEYMKKTEGWEVGVGPSVVLVDEGLAKSLTTTTAKDGVYAFIFGHKGLMAGIGIQGSKITRINPAAGGVSVAK